MTTYTMPRVGYVRRVSKTLAFVRSRPGTTLDELRILNACAQQFVKALPMNQDVSFDLWSLFIAGREGDWKTEDGAKASMLLTMIANHHDDNPHPHAYA